MNMKSTVVKYILEGLAVAIAAFLIPQRNIHPVEIVMIAISAAVTFALLDKWSPGIAAGTRQGTGFGIGFNIVRGMSGGSAGIEWREGFEAVEDTVKDTSNNLTVDNVPYDLVH